MIVYLLVSYLLSFSDNSYSGRNINMSLNAPDLTEVKASLSEGAARIGGKVLSLFYFFNTHPKLL